MIRLTLKTRRLSSVNFILKMGTSERLLVLVVEKLYDLAVSLQFLLSNQQTQKGKKGNPLLNAQRR